MVLTAVDYRSCVEEGVSIMKSVNDSINSGGGPFVLVGDIDVQIMKSFWYKIQCTVCRELFLLCPTK